MEKIIKYLCDIEDKAFSIVNRASDEKKQMTADLETEIRKFDEEVLRDRQNQIERLKSSMEDELTKELMTLEEDCNRQLKDMDEFVANNRGDIVNRLFESLIHC